MQTSFSELVNAAQKKPARRDQFLSEIEAGPPWVAHFARRRRSICTP